MMPITLARMGQVCCADVWFGVGYLLGVGGAGETSKATGGSDESVKADGAANRTNEYAAGVCGRIDLMCSRVCGGPVSVQAPRERQSGEPALA